MMKAAPRADFSLDQASGRGERHVRCDGCDNDEINLVRRDRGLFHGAQRSLGRKI
jgi:hypothetical protein